MNGITKVEMERLKFSIFQALSPEMMEGAEMDIIAHHMANHITVEWRKLCWAEKAPLTEQIVVYPADWWQAFKDQFFSRWLKRRFPVRFKRAVLSMRAVYPDFHPTIPDQHYFFIVQRLDEEGE